MKDVDFLLHNGTYRVKAMTPQAAEVFCELLQVPAKLQAGGSIFLTGIKPENWENLKIALHARGLRTEDEPDPAVASLWDV